MKLQLGYPNARSVAYAVKAELENQGWGHLTPRPWNMYDPDNTFWWLVPGPEWPAYKYGKLFFSPDRAPDGCILCGMHVEKGLDNAIEAAYPSAGGRRLIMKENWSWHNFFKDLGSIAVQSSVRQISKEIDQPVLVRIEAGYVDDPGSFDPQATRPKWDVVSFKASDEFFVLEESELTSGLLEGVSNSQSLYMLMNAIPAIPNVNWVWIDCFIGNIFMKSPNITDINVLNAKQLCKKSLSKLKSWIR